jgi:hypothetical protein
MGFEESWKLVGGAVLETIGQIIPTAVPIDANCVYWS